MTRKEAFIALNMVPHLGPVPLRRLLDIFDSPERVLSAKRNELQRIDGLNQALIDSLASWESVVDLQQELARISNFGASVLTLEDPDYPTLLREIHDPPTVLYVWGKLEPRDHHAVGVVGSRRTSHYGLECAKKISYQIAYAGLTVVSGLARGIDTASHQGALAAKGRTVAVLGTGLHHLYPAENRALAEKIVAAGAVVTEFPMETMPDRQTFPIEEFFPLLANGRFKTGVLLKSFFKSVGIAVFSILASGRFRSDGSLQH